MSLMNKEQHDEFSSWWYKESGLGGISPHCSEGVAALKAWKAALASVNKLKK